MVATRKYVDVFINAIHTCEMHLQLNLSKISHAISARNLSFEDLALRLDVLPDAVKTWLSGEVLPVPHRLLRLSALLDMSFDEMLVKDTPALATPVVAYRKVAGKVTTEIELEMARAKGRLLEPLAQYLPNQSIRPATLREPSSTYEYLQRAVSELRQDIGVPLDGPIKYSSLIGKFKQLGAVIVPVMWGKRELHGNALHIRLPDSESTWIYLNLDVNACDFNFWMAHELAHVFTPTMAGKDEGEDFADAFAQALLFPKICAARLHEDLKGVKSGAAINHIVKVAKNFQISPFTIVKSLNAYQKNSRLRVFDKLHYGTVKNFEKTVPLVSAMLFGEKRPDAAKYVADTTEKFKTPIFEIMCAYLADSAQGAGWLAEVLEIPILDAQAMFESLTTPQE